MAPDMCNDKDVMLAAVAVEGTKLRMASSSLQADVQVVVAALTQCIEAMAYVPPSLHCNKEVHSSIIKRWGHIQFATKARFYSWSCVIE